NSEAINLLLDHGADVNAREKEYGETPLMFAAANDRVLAIRTLVGRGAHLGAWSKVTDVAAETAATRGAGAARGAGPAAAASGARGAVGGGPRAGGAGPSPSSGQGANGAGANAQSAAGQDAAAGQGGAGRGGRGGGGGGNGDDSRPTGV